VIEQCGGDDAGEDRPGPPEPARQDERQELRLVADLRQRHQPERDGQSLDHRKIRVDGSPIE